MLPTLSASNFFNESPELRVLYNVGALLDIPTGEYILGIDGESILNGGLNLFTGVAGRGNTYKSTLAQYMILTCMARNPQSFTQSHDSETSSQRTRWNSLARLINFDPPIDFRDTPRFLLTDNTTMSGNEWFKGLQKFADDKVKSRKQWLRETPFVDVKTNKLIEVMYPTFSFLDSISQLQTDNIEEIFEKNEIGEGAANTAAMRAAGAKTQLLDRIPTLTGKSEIRSVMTAHMGDDIPLDQYSPNPRKLGFMKGKDKLKNCPEKFTFLVNNLWHVLAATVFANQTSKAPEYPRDENDDHAGSTDLMVLQIRSLRVKSGPTGMVQLILASQSEGILASLTEFHFCKTHDRFGLGGNDRNYYFELLPEVALQRTTVRRKLDGDARLRRVANITAEMCQMDVYWNLKPEYRCTPKELYDDLKAKGYDWNRLYETRGYWQFVEDAKNSLPYLSTMDLLRMRTGEYHPKWYGELKSS